MEEKNVNQEVNKPTYEELKNYCDQLLMQRNQLAQKLQQITNILNKMPWLFEVIKAHDFFNEEFVQRCAQEIEDIMTPPAEEEAEKEDKKEE